METKFYVIIFGALALIVSAIVGGLYLHNGWGMALVVAGIVAGIVWIIGMFQLGIALNSDI